ncbi:MAG: putative CRISPR-associated protein [Infirmifilum sp.]
MGNTHIVTVGTSILRNAASKLPPNTPPEVAARIKRWSTAPAGSPEDAEAGNAAAPGTPEFKAVLSIVQNDPRQASAELNAMGTYLEQGSVDEVILLSTDSGASEFCAKILKEYLLQTFGIRNVETRRIPDLGRDFEKGLYNLLDTLSTITKRNASKNKKTYLNLTGGFKPETAVAYLAASLLGIDRVYYVHETMREVVELPTLPITIKKDYAAAMRVLLEPHTHPEIKSKILEELERRGLVERQGSNYKIRRWVQTLLPLTE